VDGLPTYQTEATDKFQRQYKALKKSYKSGREGDDLVSAITGLVDTLAVDPECNGTYLEPWPARSAKEGWEFRKYYFKVPHRQGASGEGRLMYFVNEDQKLIILALLYTHDQYEGRPPNSEINAIIDGL
jgi:hypothetical protein